MSEATRSIAAANEFSVETPAASEQYHLSGWIFGLKRGFDISIAIIAILLLTPLLATIALVLLAAQGRPVFIKHRRVGRAGAFFPCLKFRTMVRNADAVLSGVLDQNPDMRREWEQSRKLKKDPRITALGRVLRESSVDEIPQLFNVLRGDMSLVGPRPIVTEEVSFYGPKIQHYYRVRPGLTGAWQVGGRSEVAFSHRVELDTAYVTAWSFKTDIKILLQTVPAVLKRKGSC